LLGRWTQTAVAAPLAMLARPRIELAISDPARNIVNAAAGLFQLHLGSCRHDLFVAVEVEKNQVARYKAHGARAHSVDRELKAVLGITRRLGSSAFVVDDTYRVAVDAVHAVNATSNFLRSQFEVERDLRADHLNRSSRTGA